MQADKEQRKARLAEKKRLLAEGQARLRQRFEGSSSDETVAEEVGLLISYKPQVILCS